MHDMAKKAVQSELNLTRTHMPAMYDCIQLHKISVYHPDIGLRRVDTFLVNPSTRGEEI